MKKRILVCGGRNYDDSSRLWKALEYHKGEAGLVIHGGAQGADALAGEWARLSGIERLVFEPEWNKHGRAAGPIRNQRMIDEGKPDIVIAFYPGGSGTADMVKRAKAAGIPVKTIW